MAQLFNCAAVKRPDRFCSTRSLSGQLKPPKLLIRDYSTIRRIHPKFPGRSAVFPDLTPLVIQQIRHSR